MGEPGHYDQRVTVRRPGATTNDGGVPVPGAPTTLYSRAPASVVNADARSMERVFGSQVQATATHVVAMRRRAVLLTDEIVWHYVIHGQATDRVLRITARAENREADEVILATTELTS
jgi:hypothetical protein